MKIVSHVAMIFLLLPTLAYSSDWKCISYVSPAVQITDPKTGEEKIVHPKNVGECTQKLNTTDVKNLPNGHVRIWISTKMSHGDKGYAWRQDLYEVDCDNKKWRFLQVGFDSLANGVPPEGPSPWYWTEPGSPEAGISEAVCSEWVGPR
jgi:hypothetical protein